MYLTTLQKVKVIHICSEIFSCSHLSQSGKIASLFLICRLIFSKGENKEMLLEKILTAKELFLLIDNFFNSGKFFIRKQKDFFRQQDRSIYFEKILYFQFS